MKIRGALIGLLVLGVASPAAADIDDWTAVPDFTQSPEHWGLELRVGVFNPVNLGDEFASGAYFGNDVGPHLSLQAHYFPFRLPIMGLVGLGIGLGWSQWDTTTPGGVSAERNVFEILEMQVMLVWRVDTLARELNVPIVLTPKLGFEFNRWLTSPGSATNPEPNGWAVGPRFAGKVSLELDFLEPRAARQLDEEWGINHSEIFFELYYSMAGDLADDQLPIGGWGWAAGLGFTF